MLGRRDPALYGGLSLARARDADLRVGARARAARVRCRQTNHEGEYVDWCHDALDDGRRRDRQPGRVDALQLGDPRRARAAHDPVVEVHLSNVDEREEWRRVSVIADLVAHASSARGRTATARRSSTSTERRVNDRLDRLRRERSRSRSSSRTRVNVRYLDRLRELERGAARRAGARRGSSPTSATSRPRARVDGVEVVQTRARRSRRRSPSGSPGRIGFEADARHRTRATRRSGRRARARAAHAASSRRCARSRTTASSTRSGARARSPTRVFERLAEERVRRPHASASSPGGSSSSSTSDGARRRSRSSRSSPPARPARCRTPCPSDRRSRRARLVVVDAGCTVDGYCSDCTRTFATGRAARRARARRTTSCLAGAAGRARRHPRRAPTAPRSTRVARDVIEAAGLRRALRPRPRPRRRPRRPRGAAAVDRESSDTLAAGQRRHRRAGRLPRRASAASGSRTSSSSPRTAPRISPRFTKELRRRRRARLAPPWPRPSTRTSSRTACTSSSTATSGASSSSST